MRSEATALRLAALPHIFSQREWCRKITAAAPLCTEMLPLRNSLAAPLSHHLQLTSVRLNLVVSHSDSLTSLEGLGEGGGVEEGCR